MSGLIVGVDIGQVSDFTAITVVEVVPVAAPEPSDSVQPIRPKPLLHVSYVERFRHVQYPVLIDHVASMAAWPVMRGAVFVIDCGGVGRPIYDALRERVGSAVAVVIGSGDVVNRISPSEFHVPKRVLTGNLQLAVAQRRVRLSPKVKHLDALQRELGNFGYDFTAAGNMITGAKGSGHDDLVLSLALAAWYATHDEANGAAAWSHYLRRMTVAPGPPARPTVPGTDADRRAAARHAAFRASQYTEGTR
jgi:hypothetical protein